MKTASGTVMDGLVLRLREQARRFNPALEVAPVVVLWTDEKREWEGIVPRIKEVLPELYSLGPYMPDGRSGPGVWLRMVADRQAGSIGASETPILYLPGVGNRQLRADLRGLKDHPQLAPIAELQYRGVFWRQENGKDWTLRSFFESRRGGLGLKIAADQETLEALRAASGKLLTQNLQALEGQLIDQRFLDDLMNPSPDETVLRWLTAAPAIQEEKGGAWASFVATTRTRFAVDLDRGTLAVAQKILASQPGEATHALWEEYCAHWQSYPDAYEVFRDISPPDLLQGAERYPRENDMDERRLSEELLQASLLAPAAAASAVLALEARHASRRETLWARMGRAPLAQATKHLADVARAFAEPLVGGSASEMAQSYADSGWRVDAAARAAMAIAQQEQLEKPIYAVLEALYRRWLERLAQGFQAMVRRDGYPHWQLPEVPPGVVLLFVDGLRFDLARELEALLATDQRLDISLATAFTSVPSVTSSGKVWVSPVGQSATGGNAGGFEPSLPKGAYTAEKLRKAMEAEVYALVDDENPTFAYGKGWAEFSGDIDSDGHHKGVRLARVLGSHLDDLARCIRRLLAAAWKEVWVVTDHGWLLLPGGLPKAELPARLTETRWGRCAVLKDAVADQDWLVLPWSFDPAVRVALAPGITAFSQGREYDHGGLSPQESVVPFLRVRREEPIAGQPRLLSVTWNTRKTICSVNTSAAVGLMLGLERLGSAIGEGEAIDSAGKGRVIFEEVDDLIGERVSLVLRRDGLKIAEEHLDFGDAWNGA